VQAGVDAWAFAAIGWHTSQNLKLARFGDNMRYVAVTDGDKVAAQIDLGISVENFGTNTLAEAVEQVSDAAANVLADEYENLYDVAPELKARRRPPRVTGLQCQDRDRAARHLRSRRLSRFHLKL
jgi:L-arabinose isomerase